MNARAQYTPLTEEERQFAAENHGIVTSYLRWRKLDENEWYDVVIFRYLLSVKKWFAQPDLHQYTFGTVARQAMRSAIGGELDKQNRRIKTVSLDAEIPGTEGLTLADTVTQDNLNFIYIGEDEMKLKFNVKIPQRKRLGIKSDEVKALDTFLSGEMENMCFEYDTLEEAQKKAVTLQTYRRKQSLKDACEIFRIGKNVYVTHEKGQGK